MQGLRQDFVYAVRTMLRSPAFAITAALTLGLGIGISVAMFSVLDGILLRPLPYKDADRLVMLWIDDPQHGVTEEGFTHPTYEDWRAMNRTFDDVAALMRDWEFLVERNGQSEKAVVSLATHNLFSLLGARPIEGRTFTAEEDQRGANVAVVNQSWWQNRFGAGSPIGTTVRIDGLDYQVIGTMPGSFEFPRRGTAAWVPWPSSGPLAKLRGIREGDWLRGIARLKPHMTAADAHRDLDRIAAILAEKYPPSDPNFAGYHANVVPLLQQITGTSLPRRLWLLLGAVGFVFFIACINVMNLMGVRNEGRRRELAVREVLGASRQRLVRLRFVESLVISLAALAIGVPLAFALVTVIVSAAPASTARLDEIRVDWMALVCAIALATAAAVLSAVFSGLRSHSSWLAGSRGSTDRGRSRALQSAFVVVQVALSLVLLCGVGLFARSLQATMAFDPGFNKEHIVLAEMDAPSHRPGEPEGPARSSANHTIFFQELLQRMKAAPGITAAGAISQFLIQLNPDYSIVVESDEQPAQVALMADAISPGYFETVGVPLLSGRTFAEADIDQDLALINQTMAEHFWPGRNPVGKRFRELDGKTWYTVIGVVGDMRRQGIENRPIPQMFRAGFAPRMTIALRTTDAASAAATLREQVRALAPGAPLPSVTTVEQTLEADRAPRTFHTWLLASFAIVALLLCAIGLFGLQRYTVERRRGEIGLRMAVGARSADVVGMVVGQGARLILLGGALGLLGSLWLADLVQGLLFEVNARDTAALAFAAVALTLVGILACYLPARKAARIDPLEALRRD